MYCCGAPNFLSFHSKITRSLDKNYQSTTNLTEYDISKGKQIYYIHIREKLNTNC